MKDPFVMNVAWVCKQIPVYLPHELLGYPKDSLPGMLLTIELVSKMNEEENKQSDPKYAARNARMQKFRRNK